MTQRVGRDLGSASSAFGEHTALVGRDAAFAPLTHEPIRTLMAVPAAHHGGGTQAYTAYGQP
jgi:hypothetical protein